MKLTELKREIFKITKQIHKETNVNKKNVLLQQRKEMLNNLHVLKQKQRLNTQLDYIVEKEIPIINTVVTNKKNDNISTDYMLPTQLTNLMYDEILNKLQSLYIETIIKDYIIGDIVITEDGTGVVRHFNIDINELLEEHKGVYVKMKRFTKEGIEGVRYLGKDVRGYKITDIKKIGHIEG